jgi:hypothetical protein
MFIRTKRVNGKEYKQLVENYRENGHHRQRVVAHLGHHATAEEALDAAREELERLENGKLIKQALEAAEAERNWRRSILQNYGSQLDRFHDGQIPSESEVARRTGKVEKAPETDEVLEMFYGRPIYARQEVPIPPEVDEYCRAFGDGTAKKTERPDWYGYTVNYPRLWEYERRIRNHDHWLRRSRAKTSELNRRRERLKTRIEKLEPVVTN